MRLPMGQAGAGWLELGGVFLLALFVPRSLTYVH